LVGNHGVAKFDNLTLPEFSLGTLKIIQLPEISTFKKAARITHLEAILKIAHYYTWPAIRSMYAVGLEDVQYGSTNWGDSIQTYKESHMWPSSLLPTQDPFITRRLAAGYIKTHIRLDAGVEISFLRAGAFLQNYYDTY
jgi:hypothetical protein